jgi:HD-GYP domain-containing protein (c-di-GMP phosphodiesterase class II)
MDEIRLHPNRGFDLVGKIVFLEEAQQGILHHHERFDGSGYPEGLAAYDIPEFGRIIAVADAFDSMTTSRSYRGARSVEEARAELERCRGTHFDPVIVDAFAESLDRYGWAPVGSEGPVAVLAGDPTIDHDDLAGVGSVPESAAADPALVALSAGSGSDPAAPA